MWYEDIMKRLKKNEIYTRQQIYSVLQKEKPDLSYNSFKWIMAEMIRKGIVCRTQRGLYRLADPTVSEKEKYRPVLNTRSVELSEKIGARFPYIDYVCFESSQLNEFLNHLIGKNTYFVLVERDAVDYVFRYLQEEESANILLKPGKKEWDAYWSDDTIVMLNLVSESPKNEQNSHEMSIEKLLVDVVAEKSFQSLYSKNEVEFIFESAERSYLVDYARLMRYARRRGKEEEVKKYIGGDTDACTK